MDLLDSIVGEVGELAALLSQPDWSRQIMSVSPTPGIRDRLLDSYLLLEPDQQRATQTVSGIGTERRRFTGGRIMSRLRHDVRTPRSTSLTGLELRNFKSIRSARIPIRPLTIVSGSNSAGKSTLLQAILALTQVSRRRIEGGRFPLNGDLVQLGTISSLKNQNSDPDDNVLVSYEFSSSIGDMSRTVGRQIGFDEKRFRKDFDVPDDEDIDSAYVKWSIELDRQFNNQIGSARIVSITIDVDGVLNQVLAEVTRNDILSDIDLNNPEEQIDEDLVVHDGWMHFTTGYGTENEPKYGERGSVDIANTTIGSGQITSLRARPVRYVWAS